MENDHISTKATYIIVAILAVILHSSCVHADALPEIQRTGNIAYVTGGIGDEERDAMKSVQHEYNLRVLSAGVSGAYPGDTHIIISDSHGHQLVNADADPFFYARMPAGHYIVEETSAGQSKKQSVVMGANQPVNITFRWQ